LRKQTTFSLDNSLVIIADFDAIWQNTCLLFGFSIDQIAPAVNELLSSLQLSFIAFQLIAVLAFFRWKTELSLGRSIR
jgi:hypothetical protein